MYMYYEPQVNKTNYKLLSGLYLPPFSEFFLIQLKKHIVSARHPEKHLFCFPVFSRKRYI